MPEGGGARPLTVGAVVEALREEFPDVSISKVRFLEAEGLVTFERNVGARVSMVDDSQYRFSMQALAILEGTATALSARRLTPDDLRNARRINELMIETLAHFDPRAFTALNQEFHAALYEKCANPRMLELVRGEWARLGHLRDSTFSFVPGRARESVDEHDRIVDLIELGADPLEIELAARRHRTATLDAMLEYQAAHKAHAATTAR